MNKLVMFAAFALLALGCEPKPKPAGEDAAIEKPEASDAAQAPESADAGSPEADAAESDASAEKPGKAPSVPVGPNGPPKGEGKHGSK